MKTFFKNRYSLPALFLFFAGISFFYFRELPLSERKTSLENYAADIFSRCANTQFAPDCYDKEIPKLTDTISLEEAFEVTKLVQEKDPRYLYCHVLGHKLSYKEAARDPKNWKDVITRCPTTFCNNGCLHGALIQRFNKTYLNDEQIEELKKDLVDVCEPRGNWNPVEVERSMCYHALGHMAMYITKADIRKAIPLCDFVGTKTDGRNYVQTCTEGIFMQVYQPLEPEDFELIHSIAPGKGTVPEFCASYKNINPFSFDACRREAWPLFRQEILKPEGYLQFCSYTENRTWQYTCWAALMNIVTIALGIESGKTADIEKFCKELPENPRLPETPRETCFAHAARQFIQIDPRYADKAFEICKTADALNAGEPCFKLLIQFGRKSFHKASRDFIEYCRGFPESWKNECLNQKGSF